MNESPDVRPEMVPQPHGGALKVGNPGNRGGTGRPPSEIRQRLRGAFEDRIPILEDIADSATASASDRMKAVDLMAKYGLGKEVSAEDVRMKLGETLDLLRRELDPETYARITKQMREVWK
jgi:hypothetical protein